MFDEDPQWNEVGPDSFEDGLHRKLFGNVGREVSAEDEAAPADTSLTKREAGGRKSKKRKHAREREVAVKGMEEGMTNRKKEGATAEERDDAETNGEGSGRGTTSKKRVDHITATQETQPRKRRKKQKTESDRGGCHTTNGSGVARREAANGTSGFTTSAHAATPTLTEPREATSSTPRKKSDLSSKLFSKMSSRLEGSRFRMLNQRLYTSTGAEAKAIFDSDPDLFDVYHRGFSTQVSKWPTNPLDRVIAHVRTLPQSSVIADFGCGEAQLAQTVPHTVHSFDLVAVNARVTACDMAHVPLAKHTVDICIFCLSLMGSNVSDFIREARRVLKRGGEMRICEVLSRFSSVDEFVRDVEAFGFELLSKTEFSKMFLELVFRTVKWDTKTHLPQIILKPCIYKRR